VELAEALDRPRRPLGESVGSVGRELEGIRHERIRRQKVRGFASLTGPAPEQSRQHPLGGLETHAFRVSHVAISGVAQGSHDARA
jgi:hypothetical protein